MRNPLGISEDEAWALFPILGGAVFDLIDRSDDTDGEDDE